MKYRIRLTRKNPRYPKEKYLLINADIINRVIPEAESGSWVYITIGDKDYPYVVVEEMKDIEEKLKDVYS